MDYQLYGLPIKDIDMATDFTPVPVTSVLESHGVKIIPTGINFGTVSAFINKEVFEITTLRKDLLSEVCFLNQVGK